MSHRVAVLIRRGDSLLLIRRVTDGQERHVIPGGDVGQGETIAAAALREAREGLSLAVTYEDVLWRQMNQGQMETYVKASSAGGEPEAQRRSGTGQDHPVWVPLPEVGGLNLEPDYAKEKIAQMVERGRL
jgi:ADP-ribose pyrophosphatase YjhB (NUDIX family)